MNRKSDTLIPLIMEMFSISDTVIKIANYVAWKIIEDIHHSNQKPFFDKTILYKNGGFSYSKYGIKFDVDWEYYGTSDEDRLEELKNTYYEANTSYKRKTLKFSFWGYKTKVDENFVYSTVQHEVNHFYEFCMSKAVYFNLPKRYVTALHMRNPVNDEDRKKMSQVYKDKDFLRRSIADAIYLSFKFESRAFANGAYQQFLRSKDHNNRYRNILPDLMEYKRLTDVRKYIELFSEIGKSSIMVEEINKALSPYNIDYPHFINLLKKTEHYMTWLLGRAMAKALNDYKEENEQTPNQLYKTLQETLKEERERGMEMTMLFKKYFKADWKPEHC